MVCNFWYLRSLLVVVLGLISFPAFAQAVGPFPYQSDALAACQSFQSSWRSQIEQFVSKNISIYSTFCYQPTAEQCSLSGSTYTLRGLGAYLLTISACVSQVPNTFSKPYSSANTASSIYYFTFSQPDPEPECPGPSAPEFNGLKAPTANGTGDVCIDGCGASIALQAPPLPLFSGAWTGQTCVATPSNTPVPAGDPNDNPCTPGDPQCPGTGDPSDPESSPGTGGGGIQCDTPPVCNADGVTCSMLYQQWRGRCEAEYARIEQRDRLDRIGDSLDNGFSDLSDGLGSLGDKVDAVGDKVDAVGTKVDAVGDKVDAVGDKVGEVNQSVKDLHADLETGFSTGGIGDPGDAAWGSVSSSTEIGVGDLDASGMGFPRVCPVFQNVNLNFGSIAVTLPFADFDMHCSLLEWLGYIIVAFSAFWAARVLLDV